MHNWIIHYGGFKNIEVQEKLPTNFKKMVENYLDVMLKTNQKPAAETKVFFEKLKENNALKALIKQILNEQ